MFHYIQWIGVQISTLYTLYLYPIVILLVRRNSKLGGSSDKNSYFSSNSVCVHREELFEVLFLK